MSKNKLYKSHVALLSILRDASFGSRSSVALIYAYRVAPRAAHMC